MTASIVVILALFLPNTMPPLVYDSGEPVPRDGDVPFMSVWRVLDPLDDLCVRVVTPIELTKQTRVTALAFYSFCPKDPADKLVKIYQGTDENSVGTLIHEFAFDGHTGVRQGWNIFVLDEPIRLAPGTYGISFHGRYEFHGYWAANAPNGFGYAWARINDTREWFCGYEQDYGMVPNFAVRLYGLQREIPLGKTGKPGHAVTPVGKAAASSAGQNQTLPDTPIDTSVPGDAG